jgi:hypothetical protein
MLKDMFYFKCGFLKINIRGHMLHNIFDLFVLNKESHYTDYNIFPDTGCLELLAVYPNSRRSWCACNRSTPLSRTANSTR